MNASNRFEIESLARQREAGIQRRLQRRMHLREALADRAAPRARRNAGSALIIAGTTALSLLLALGVSFVMLFAFAVIP